MYIKELRGCEVELLLEYAPIQSAADITASESRWSSNIT